MKTSRTTSSLHHAHRRRVAIDRRAALMLSIGGVVGLASQSNSARAETRTTDSQFRDLKAVGPERQVVTMRHHRDSTFEVLTADGRSTSFQETDLRFKIDTSEKGPPVGRPAILPRGMVGDRATVFFASPAEIGTLIEHRS
jgi:hypothetical protein